MKNRKYNKVVQNTIDNIHNFMMYLYEKKIAYYYNYLKIDINGDHVKLSWNNHESSRANCGETFTSLEQYEHILKNDAFHLILYDGSIIRTSLSFESNILVAHNHLWWPSPYTDVDLLTFGESPQVVWEDFIVYTEWRERIRMRSPIRMDFDPFSESENHPLIHMHTQYHDSRIVLDQPIDFISFVEFIIKNFYPESNIDFEQWHKFDYIYNKGNYQYDGITKIII